jgi:Bifunctional DNA primase/polymerase, N-terminal
MPNEGSGPDQVQATSTTPIASANSNGSSQPDGYAAAHLAYRAHGWTPIKLAAGTKFPPPTGFTGADGIVPSGADMAAWADEEPGGNIALRLPPDVIGVDVDCWGDKTGAATLTEAEKRWGKLPYSPKSTSRGDGSGIRLYRIPAGVRLTEGISFPELELGGIDIVQHHHRYVMSWPSVHPNGGTYHWLGIDNQPLDAPPFYPDDLPALPEPWLTALTAPEHSSAGADGPGGVYDGPSVITEGEPSPRVLAKLTEAMTQLFGSACRHDAIRDSALGLLRLGKQGQPGVKAALKTLEAAFANAVGPDRAGGRNEAINEFRGFIFRKPPSGGQWEWVLNEKVAKLLGDESYDDPDPAYSMAAPQPPPVSLPAAHKVFRKWLGDDYDTDALDAMLATAAVEKFTDGSDPVWLLIISGPGNAKTETAQALDGIGATVTSTLTSDAALLSATPKRERTKDATGGLLRKIGESGVLVIKDVTSILTMNRDMRGRVLAAFREIYDGRWYREVGSDGGQTIPWTGRIAVVGAVTTAWDTAHSVIATMGDRFVLVRMDSTKKRAAAGRKAIGNTGDEPQMRRELAAAAGGVIAAMNTEAITITEEETDALIAAADLVTLARTAVEYDYRGDVIDAHAPEMPTRFAKQLTQIVRGAVAIGLGRADALRLAIRCARDSMPPLRLAIIDDVADHPHSTATDVRRRIGKPRTTVDRQLQALHMLGVLVCTEVANTGFGTSWHYSLTREIDPEAIDPKNLCT